MNPAALFRPWFVFRPGQLVRRVTRAVRPPRDPVQVVGMPWGCAVELDTRETIGRSVWTTGVYDLAVTEVLARLADPALLSLDVGANIGVMTGLLAGRSGEVWAFEPNPAVVGRLRGNVGRFAGRPGFAPATVFDLALSDADGEATLETPADSAGNHGLGRLAAPGTAGVRVRTARLDPLLAGREVGVMKLDVEGHELAVLAGAADALAAGRVRAVVFEDHDGPDSPVGRFLAGFGFRIYGLGWSTFGPVVADPGGRPSRPFEAPSYLATQSDVVVAACRRRGWVSLQGRG